MQKAKISCSTIPGAAAAAAAVDLKVFKCHTDPKFLNFAVPNVKIFGDRDIFVKSSSTVQLRCVVSQSLVPPTYIEWRHNDQHLPLATSALSIGSHKGARLQTTPPEHIAAGTTVSTLTILHAELSDSGKYTCLPAQLQSASVNLHVLESKLNSLQS